MTRAVVLDGGPVGLLTYSKGSPDASNCNRWLHEISESGVTVVLPEIIDYEIRRELLRLRQVKGLLRLETLLTIPSVHFEPITTSVMRLAAEFWAQVANRVAQPATRRRRIVMSFLPPMPGSWNAMVLMSS